MTQALYAHMNNKKIKKKNKVCRLIQYNPQWQYYNAGVARGEGKGKIQNKESEFKI
jgi:hypothetical protein